VVRPGDLRTTVRKGRRVGTENVVLYVLERGSSQPTRFGFVVGKVVGTAVRRNLVRRRLRAIGREVLEGVPTGSDIVIRALPGSEAASWVTLRREVADAIDRSVPKP
jgi:ribonuclease P protein component